MGRWDTQGVPHKGWACDDVEDYEDAVHTCEMCGHESIRYVHVMTHRDYHAELRVGCICAEKMCAGYDGKRAEQQLRNRSGRRTTFLTSGWKASAKGNLYRKRKGVLVIVGLGPYGHFASVGGVYLRGKFDDLAAAKIAAFNRIDRR